MHLHLSRTAASCVHGRPLVYLCGRVRCGRAVCVLCAIRTRVRCGYTTHVRCKYATRVRCVRDKDRSFRFIYLVHRSSSWGMARTS